MMVIPDIIPVCTYINLTFHWEVSQTVRGGAAYHHYPSPTGFEVISQPR